MKKNLLFIIILGASLSIHAQQKKDKCSEEEFQAKKEAYICKQAGLTEEEAKDFFSAEAKNNELEKKYLKKYQQVLSNKKIYMVLRAEIKFHRNMLKIMQEKPKEK